MLQGLVHLFPHFLLPYGIMFDEDRFRELVRTHVFGKHTVYFETIDSTNTWLKHHGGRLPHGTFCIADGQTQGRGQYQRKWQASKGENLTWSILLRPSTQESLFLLTLAFMAAMGPVVERHVGAPSMVKWPNDLIVQKRKLAGVLAEGVFNGSRMDRFIIGIGLNVNQVDFEGLPYAGSMKGISGRDLDREALLAQITDELEVTYERWLERDPALIRDINQRLMGYGDWVGIEVDGQELEGDRLFLGVNPQGHIHIMDREYSINTYTYEQVRILTR